MNTNNEILSQANEILNDIRARKERVKQLGHGLRVIEGKTQEKSTFNLGNELKIDLSYYGRGYMYEMHKHYSTAMVFVKRGIREEIEMHKSIIKDQENNLSKIDLVRLSK